MSRILPPEFAPPFLTFAAVLGAMALWEAWWPRNLANSARKRRWRANLGISVLNAVTLWILFPTAALGMASAAADRGWGLLSALDLPRSLQIAASILALDLAIYFQHVLFHAVPAFWRLHRVHHADPDLDVSTGVRFHPLEMILSLLYKMGAIALIGAPVTSVVLFESLLIASSLFQHANVRLPGNFESGIRRVIVTPDMHRVHHSERPEETHSNFGLCLSWWDRLFGTYIHEPREGLSQIRIGIPGMRNSEQSVAALLALPFEDSSGERTGPSPFGTP